MNKKESNEKLDVVVTHFRGISLPYVEYCTKKCIFYNRFIYDKKDTL